MNKPRLFLCLTMMGASAMLAPAKGDAFSENRVKAAFLAKFAPFIDWPASAFASANAPIAICVIGADPFGPMLDQAASAPSGNRKLVVRRIPEANAETSTFCHIVYVTDSQSGYDAVDALKDKPVVTVTDSSMRARGIINFLTQDSHVRFDIDEASAEKNGIHFSSKLLGVARNVTRPGGAP